MWWRMREVGTSVGDGYAWLTDVAANEEVGKPDRGRWELLLGMRGCRFGRRWHQKLCWFGRDWQRWCFSCVAASKAGRVCRIACGSGGVESLQATYVNKTEGCRKKTIHLWPVLAVIQELTANGVITQKRYRRFLIKKQSSKRAFDEKQSHTSFIRLSFDSFHRHPVMIWPVNLPPMAKNRQPVWMS